MKSLCLVLTAGVLFSNGVLHASDTPARAHAPADEARAAIDDVLNRYVAAMQAKDLAALKALWPGMEESQAAKIEEAFRFTRVLRIELEVAGVQVDGRKAVVSCKRKDQVVTVEGQSFKSARQATITLERGSGWLITAITIK